MQSNVLTARGEHQRAAVTADRALEIATRKAPEQRPVCLRQVALSRAYLREETASRTALDEALTVLAEPTDGNSHSGYCTPSSVEMEGALCLLVLRSPQAAAEACRRALEAWPVDSVRDEGMCRMRLAMALLDLNELDEACTTATLAATRIQQAPSARSLHMLRSISRLVQPFREHHSVRELREVLAIVA